MAILAQSIDQKRRSKSNLRFDDASGNFNEAIAQSRLTSGGERYCGEKTYWTETLPGYSSRIQNRSIGIADRMHGNGRLFERITKKISLREATAQAGALSNQFPFRLRLR
jgi:hypothetical protein